MQLVSWIQTDSERGVYTEEVNRRAMDICAMTICRSHRTGTALNIANLMGVQWSMWALAGTARLPFIQNANIGRTAVKNFLTGERRRLEIRVPPK